MRSAGALLVLALDRAVMARALITAVVIMGAMAIPAVITDGRPELLSRFSPATEV
jgi:hypothetical protein